MNPQVFGAITVLTIGAVMLEGFPGVAETEKPCTGQVGMTICSENEDVVEPRHVHAHAEYDAFGGFIPSGEAVNSTTTGPSHGAISPNSEVGDAITWLRRPQGFRLG